MEQHNYLIVGVTENWRRAFDHNPPVCGLTEFSIPEENRRIDVIWRREVRGTPTYAFEVELSGGLDKAINKLYRCYRLWSTLPRLIAPVCESAKVEQIASSLEPRFKDLVISVSPEKIMDIYGKKKDFKYREREIGLL